MQDNLNQPDHREHPDTHASDGGAKPPLAQVICSASDVDREIRVLLIAKDLIENDRVPKRTWYEWDSFAGQSVLKEEANADWMCRILRIAWDQERQNAEVSDRSERFAAPSGSHSESP